MTEKCSRNLASISQESLWSLNVIDGPNSAYNTLFSSQIIGKYSIEKFKNFFIDFINRHSTLRSTFKIQNGQLYTQIQEENNLHFEVIDVSKFSQNKVFDFAKSLSLKYFDLANGPLFRVFLLVKSKENAILLVSTHHTVSDGFSLQILADELNKSLSNVSIINSPSLCYSKFSKWQHDFIESETALKQKKYWKNRLGDNFENISFHDKDLKFNKYDGDIFQFEINEDCLNDIKELAKNTNTSIFSVFLTVYQIFIYKYSNICSIVIGHPSSGRLRALEGRKRSHFNDNIGYFVNPLLFKNEINSGSTFQHLLTKTHELITNDFKNQDYPFSRLYNDLKLKQKNIELPQFVINFQKRRNDHRDLAGYKFNVPNPKDIDAGSIKLKPFYIPQQLGAANLEWEILESNNRIYCNLKFRQQSFKKDSIVKISSYLKEIFKKVLSNKNILIKEIDLLTEKERKEVLHTFNCKQSIKFDPLSLLCTKFPQNTAIINGSKRFTYSELIIYSDNLSKIIKNKLKKSDEKIALLFTRSPEYIISIFAVINSGNSFIPIDPDLPDSRIEYMLQDSSPSLVLSNSDRFSHHNNFLKVDHKSLNECSSNINSTLQIPKNYSKNIYTLYTSGSTGKPKGITNTVEGVANMINSVRDNVKVTSKDNILQFASCSFDASICEIFLSLSSGATLTLINKNVINKIDHFLKYLIEHNVTTAILPPPYLNTIGKQKFKTLKNLITGGESPIPEDAFFHNQYLNYFNVYGPTETAVITSIFKLKSDHQDTNCIPIGKAIKNTFFRILNKDNQPCPIGYPGEICISGIGVGLGYHNRKELTKEKFISDPFLKNTPMFKTGDIGKWTEDGNVLFLGRKDNQIKINGFRVELNEIESKIIEIQEIEDCAVILNEKYNNKNLVSFIKPSSEIDSNTIKDILSKQLPYYMIPTEIIQIEKFPLTNSGKKDNSKLLAIYNNATQNNNKSNINESLDLRNSLYEIWSSILNKENINMDANFFDEGGNSLQVVDLKNRIEENINIDIEITDFYKHTSINSQLDLIKNLNNELGKTNNRIADISPKSMKKNTDIAIIGMAGSFPGAHDINTLWENLIKGENSISKFTLDELLNSGIDEEILQDSNYIRAKGLLKDADHFDADFFNYSPREAELIDPQHRVFLECVYHSLENAGYAPSKYSGRIGLFASCSHNSYLTNNILSQQSYSDQDYYSVLTSNEKDFLSSRVSYKLNLKGPSQTIQTACSSSLVGVFYACNSIIDGTSDIAIAGGVSISLPLLSGYPYSKEGIGSPDGICRPFDKNAAGTVPGNGVAAVVLKSLDKAIEENDTIYAVIKSVAINNDGNEKIGFTAPSVSGQKNVIKKAHIDAGIKPEEIKFIETHGTGTLLGDPIEFKALKEAFDSSKIGFCNIGSIKANIGHLDAAAGVTSLIKAALSIYYNKFPGNINFKTPNPEINLKNSPFKISKEIINLPSSKIPYYASVSSFGIGGTNAHAILNNLSKGKSDDSKRQYYLIPLSSKKYSSLEILKEYFSKEVLNSGPNHLADLSYTLQVGRDEHPLKAFMIIDNKGKRINEWKFSDLETKKRKIAFKFSNFNSQSLNNIKSLYQKEYTFQTIANSILADISKILNQKLKIITDKEGIYLNTILDNNVLSEKQLFRVTLFLFNISLHKVFLELDLKPEILINNTDTEIEILYAAQIIDLQTALTLMLQTTDKHNIVNFKFHLPTSDCFIKPFNKIIPSNSNLTENNILTILNNKEKDSCNFSYNKKEKYLFITTFEEDNNVNSFSVFVKNSLYSFLNIIGNCWLNNENLNWKNLYKNEKRKRIPLLNYPFDRKRFWIERKYKKEVSSNKIERFNSPKDWLYAPIWKPTVLSNKNYSNYFKKASFTWLIFKDDIHLSDSISTILNDCNNTVITVSFRKNYSEAKNHYSINPLNKNDYDRLFVSLMNKNILPDHIVHIPLLTKDRYKNLIENNLKPISYLGFYSLLFMTKALQHIKHRKCKITVISDHVFSVNGEDWINPLKSTVIGPINVIPQEHPGITCQHIDISLNSNTVDYKQISEYIMNDLANFKKEKTIAYRNHRRWIKSYEKLDIEPGEINLKEGNVYLITGGLGGIGLKTAKFIAKSHNVTLILSGKNVLPPEDKWDHILEKYEKTKDPLLKKIKVIKEIRALGTKVITLCVDLQDRLNLSTELEAIEKYHGKINGIIHAAGTGGNQLISTKTIEDVESVFDPKIKGTLYLQSYFSHHKLDFFILFSSLSSIGGGIEQVAYSSANAFLDAVAAHNFSDRHLQTLAINWPGWKDTGLALKLKNYDTIKHLQDSDSANVITPNEGIEALKLCLSLGPTYRLIISPLNFNQWRNSINKDLEKEISDISNTQLHDRPEMLTKIKLAKSRDEREMAIIWENILHTSPIGIKDNFFDLGGHSLLGLELLAQIAKVKKCSLQLNDLYENPTISSILKCINQKNLLNPFAEFKIKRTKNRTTNLIIEIKKGTSNKNLYLFQPAGVNIFYYNQLAEKISDKINVYGVRLTDLEEGHNIPTSIEKIASRCAEQLIHHFNDESINLSGSSFGGVIAYEAAQQLKNKGKKINHLSMFDSPGPGHLPVEPKDNAEILHRIFSQWLPISLSILKQEKDLKKQCKYIMNMVEQDSETGFIITPDQIELLLSISKNSIIALQTYKPLEYTGSLLFIKPLDFHPNYDKNSERAWRNLVKGKFTIKNVPGDHLTMNIHPNVKHISNILSQELL